jgi:type II secretory pathway component GspD/PulD (secretin)
LNESSVSTLQHVTLHAAQGDAATFRAGSRFPILNTSFSPISNSPALSKVIGNNSFITPFPSFSYEDLGLTLKAKPAIHGTSSVTLDLELQLRALGGQSFNGVPVLVDREYKGTITVKDGEPAIVAGTMSNSETKSMSGIPGFGQFPGLSSVTSSNNKQHDQDELLILITPHVVNSSTSESTEVWLPSGR